MKGKKAFTLIEVLISIMLVGLLLPPLYKLINLMNDSNAQIFSYVKKQSITSKIIDTLYLDILSSDGNISIVKNDFTRLCINHTNNSLYGLHQSKVCWVVLKDKHKLIRTEGSNYNLPLNLDKTIYIDNAFEHMELFDIYRSKSDILVLLKRKSQEPITFAIYGVQHPSKKKKKKKKQNDNKKARKPK